MAAKDLYEKDFYKILDVDKKATADEIKKRYRSLARDLHPDKNQIALGNTIFYYTLWLDTTNSPAL